jgi:hypothetical protein
MNIIQKNYFKKSNKNLYIYILFKHIYYCFTNYYSSFFKKNYKSIIKNHLIKRSPATKETKLNIKNINNTNANLLIST